MSKLYEILDVDEETPVQYAAVHIMHWRPEWGEPEALFREADPDTIRVAFLEETERGK